MGQKQDNVTLLGVNEGLSQGMIFDVHQTRDGFLWVATKDGLNRYDGYRFEVYTNDSFDPFSIISNEVWKIFEDSRGWLWLVCPERLDLFLPDKGLFFHILPDMPGMNGDMVFFAELKDGTIWLTVNGKCWKIKGALDMLKKATQASNSFPALSITEIQLAEGLFSSVYLTDKGSLLLGSTQGLFQVDRIDNSLQTVALPGTPVKVFGQDEKGNVWINAIATDLTELYQKKDCGGLWLWNENQSTLSSIPCLPYGRQQFGPDGSLWTWHSMGTVFSKWKPENFADGRDPELNLKVNHGIVENEAFYIRNVSFDRSELIWLGTNGYGVIKTSIASRKFTSYLEHTTQRMIIEDTQGHLFTTGYQQTAYRSTQFKHTINNPWAIPPVLGDDRSITVFDEQGNAWINNNRGSLFRIDANTKALRDLSWKGLGLIRSKNGKLFSVHKEGLIQLDPRTEQTQLITFDSVPKSPLSFQHSHFLYEGPHSTVWIFAFKGLIEARPEGGSYQYHYYKNEPADLGSLSEDNVLSVAADPLEPGRYLWIGTKGGGLNRLDRSNATFRHFKKEDGLPDNVVYGILPDDQGHLWLSTNRGLCRFHVRTKTTRNFTVADGLQSNEFNQSSYLRTRDGHLIFGGVNGLTVFHPDSLQFNEKKPTTAITRVWINNKEKKDWLIQSSRSLAHDQNLVTIEMAALEYSNPAQNRYRYQLLRKSLWSNQPKTDWINLGTDNRVQFANLRPGHYTFYALGSNNDGIWGEQPALLEFTIQPPWWATWWAYLTYALLTGLAIGLIYRTQLHQRLKLQEAVRLKELDQFKNRFFVNITHEFRTPLTVILGLSRQLKQTLSGGESVHKIDLIRRNGENLLRLINQLLNLAKLESDNLKLNYIQGDVLPYLRYVVESLHSLANVRGVTLQVQSPPDPIVMDYDPERLQQIVYNLLSNAIKFTSSGGKVILQTSVARATGQQISQLILLVKDTGIGIAPEDLPRIFDRFHQANHLEKALTGGTGIGLALTRELVHAMGGEIKVDSELGNGTEFRVQIPIHQGAALAQADLPEIADPLPAKSENSPTGSNQAQLPKLLIIEDNPDVLQYLASCLEASFVLSFACNGVDGIDMACKEIPDLIISDVMMPEKDGFEVCAALKEDERTSHIPIILLTARAGVEDRIAGLRRGADAYLAKPFHEEELQATINNLLELRRKLQEKYRKVAFAKEPSPRPSSTGSNPEHAFLQKARSVVFEHLSDSTFNVADLSQALALSQRQLHRKLTALTGLSPVQLIRSMRLTRAKELLLAGGKNVSEVAYEVGFDDPKYFSRVFTAEFGLPPSKV